MFQRKYTVLFKFDKISTLMIFFYRLTLNYRVYLCDPVSFALYYINENEAQNTNRDHIYKKKNTHTHKTVSQYFPLNDY